MTLEEKVRYLTEIYPEFANKTIRDQDSRGNVFYDLIIENRSQPSMPLTVSVKDEGCVISVGLIENVTGGRPVSHEIAAAAISDILSDKVIFVMGFDKKEVYGIEKPSFTQVFALSGREDDMQKEYDSFISKISKPLSKLARPFTSLKGKFIITDFSGSINNTITR